MQAKMQLDAGWIEWDMLGDEAEIGDRLVPTTIVVTIPGSEGQPTRRMLIDSSTGVPRCVGLRFDSLQNGREVTRSDLEGIRLEDELEDFVKAVAKTITARDEDGAVAAVLSADENARREAGKTIQNARRSARRVLNDDVLRRVAETYLNAESRPVKAVQAAFGVEARTASRYVQRAREAGYLPKTTQGKASPHGQTGPRSAASAEPKIRKRLENRGFETEAALKAWYGSRFKKGSNDGQ